MKLFGKKTEPVRCAGAIIMCAMMYLAIAAPNLQAQAIGPTQIGIIGSGTMGSGIAAQLCNANVPVTLLDLKTETLGR